MAASCHLIMKVCFRVKRKTARESFICSFTQNVYNFDEICRRFVDVLEQMILLHLLIWVDAIFARQLSVFALIMCLNFEILLIITRGNE